MITYNELKEKCTCWKGYKRVPGTKPCAEDSCMKEEAEKHHVMAFGRMNPITSGHEAVVNKVHEVAKAHNASHNVIVSHSQDAKKNPLTGEQKVKHAKNAFPGTNVSSASKESPTILHHAAAAHASGAQHLHVVAGSDRHEEMHKLLHKYNDQKSAHGHYNFKSITVHSSGERDPDSEGTTGISASKMREHAASGNKEAFHAGAPSKMKPEHKDAMYHDVRKGMNIKEETVEQQDDHAKQLKRFKDQMSKANGPTKETETEMDNLEKEIMMGKTDSSHGLVHNPDPMVDSHVRVGKIKYHLGEKLDPHAGAGAWIHDFISSTHPRFNNKSKEERRKMAIGAYMAAKAKLKEEVQIDELSTELLGKYKTAAHASAKASDEAGNYKKGDKRFSGINKATRKQFDNDLKKHGQLKEGNYEKAEENKRSADSAKEQGDMFAHHLHMADHHDNLAQWHSEKGRHGTADSHAKKSEEHHEKAMALKEGTMQPNGTDQIDTATSAPTASTAKDTTMGTKVKGFKFFKGENDKQMNMNQPVKEETEVLDEKSQQARRNKTYKNLMAASKGARVNRELGMTPADTGHKNNQQMNKAIGRAVTRGEVFEVATGNPGNGYHGQVQSPDEKYEATHKHVKNLTDGDDKTVKHYMDSTHGRHLAGRENDHEYIKKDFKKFKKYYKPEMHEAVAPKAVNVDKVNHAGDKPHEEKWEPAKNVSKLKKEETMKSYKEFLQSLDEKLVGGQKKLDKNHNNKLDAQDFKMLRKEETEALDEIKMADLPSRKIQGKSYGANYEDPEGAFETKDDMKKADKKPAGRKTGQRTGSYKPRATMSKLKAAGATYK